jgi:hypothetical protein
VWDGENTLFEFNYLALGIGAEECFRCARQRELPVGKPLRVYLAAHYTEDLPKPQTDPGLHPLRPRCDGAAEAAGKVVDP